MEEAAGCWARGLGLRWRRSWAGEAAEDPARDLRWASWRRGSWIHARVTAFAWAGLALAPNARAGITGLVGARELSHTVAMPAEKKGENKGK